MNQIKAYIIMKSLKYLLILFVSFAVGACDSANSVNNQEQPRDPSFVGIGDLAGGDTFSVANDVSAAGSIVVGTSTGADGAHAFRWEGGTMTALPHTSEYDGERSEANGISPDGSVIVGGAGTFISQDAMRWEGGSMQFLGRFPDHTDAPTYGLAASTGGDVIVGWELGEAFRWEAGTISRLGDYPGGGQYVSANDITPDGRVIVGAGGQPVTGGPARPFIRVEGVTTDLGVLAAGSADGGREEGWARAVTPDGSIVVGSSSYAGADERGEVQPFRWEDDEMVGLGFLSGHTTGYAEDVSADGSVVVGWTSPGPEGDSSKAFIWTEAGGIRDLKSVLEDDHGLDLSGWALTRANAISHDGAVIVGGGVNPAGDREGWRAVLGSR